MADKIVRARVVGDQPYFNQAGVLVMPGEDTEVNLTKLGVSSLDDKATPGLEAHGTKTAEAVVEAPIAAVAPHAPEAPNPQGMAPGSVMSGTGRIITPAPDADEAVTAPVGADKPLDQKEAAAAAAPPKVAKPAKK